MKPKKARIFEATVRDGYGERTDFFAAPTKARLTAALRTDETCVVRVRQETWGAVTCEPDDETNDVQFVCTFNGTEKRVRSGDIEHRFLQGYLFEETVAVRAFISGEP